jgi:hypothetical protein
MTPLADEFAGLVSALHGTLSKDETSGKKEAAV